MAFGGPANYKGKDMTAAHAHLMPRLNEGHFNAIVEAFVGTLQELKVGRRGLGGLSAPRAR